MDISTRAPLGHHPPAFRKPNNSDENALIIEGDSQRICCEATELENSDTQQQPGDRKSTRLNSSHGYISYAVFCLKKKNTQTSPHPLVPTAVLNRVLRDAQTAHPPPMQRRHRPLVLYATQCASHPPTSTSFATRTL